ncbi:MAG: hypothetical protein JNM27_02180 [Leptospirales bacterium]|nr:hypothetical protein [Leptospirales bacterium]
MKAGLSDVRIAIDRTIEQIVAAIRGEAKARTAGVHQILEDGVVDKKALASSLDQDAKNLQTRATTLGTDTSDDLTDFLTLNRGKTFLELMTLINGQVNAAQSLDLSDDGYGLATAANPQLAKLSMIRQWIQSHKTVIDTANHVPIPADTDQTTVVAKWDALLLTLTPSTVSAQTASYSLSRDTIGLTMQQLALSIGQSAAAVDTNRMAARDQVKSIIGFYKTDANGRVLKDAAGKPLVAQEFVDLGITDPDADLLTTLAGKQSGVNLQRWSERILVYLSQQQNQSGVDPAVLAGAQNLEKALRDLITARTYIENRNKTAADMKATSKLDTEKFGALTAKAGIFARFESTLASATRQARDQGNDPVDAALSVLESVDALIMFKMFLGFDAAGKADGYADPDMQKRADELKNLANELRRTREMRTVTAVSDLYASMLDDYLLAKETDPSAVAPDVNVFLTGQGVVKTNDAVTAITALADADFDAKIREWITNAPANAFLSRGRVIEILSSSTSTGAALKAEILAGLGVYTTELSDQMTVLTGQLTTTAGLDRTTEKAIADLLTKHIAKMNTADPPADALAVDLRSLLATGVAALDAIIDAEGHASATGAERDALRENLRKAMLANYIAENQASSPAAVIQLLRSEAVRNQIYPDAAAKAGLNEFVKTESGNLNVIEGQFFAELDKSSSALAVAAKNDRGKMLEALIARKQGQTTTYYDSLSPALKAEIDSLSTRFFAGLDTAQSTGLIAKSGDYSRMFDLRSGQELVTSGIFEGLESSLFAEIEKSGNKTLIDQARNNRNALLRAMIEQMQGSLSAESATLFGLIGGSAVAVTQAIASMNPNLKNVTLQESVLVNRVLTQFMEDDALRGDIESILNDPGLFVGNFAKSLRRDPQKKLGAIFQKGTALADSILTNGETHIRDISGIMQNYGRKLEAAAALKEFAERRGDDPLTSRFSNYRTHIGAERNYQMAAYKQYLRGMGINPDTADPNNPGGGAMTFTQMQGGLLLEAESLNLDPTTIFSDPDWESKLISDDPTQFDSVQVDPNDPTTTIQIKHVGSISDPASRQGLAAADELARTYQENLANNYLEAVTRLNAAFNTVFEAAKISDTMHTTSALATLKTKIGTFDAETSADLTDFTSALQEANGRVANHGETQVQGKKQAIAQSQSEFNKSADEFADAARRNQIRTMNLLSQIQGVYAAIADQFEVKKNAVAALSDIATNLEAQFGAANQTYVDALNEMADRFRKVEGSRNEYDTRLAVKEYAETPYLYSASGDEVADLNAYATGAQEEYDRAAQVLALANENLANAGYQVQIQDNLAGFNDVAVGMANNVTYAPLSAAERDQLLNLRDKKIVQKQTLTAQEELDLKALTDRETYEIYGTLITLRAEDIKQTMREVRLRKASELVNGEINRLTGIVEEKKKKFETALTNNFGGADTDEIKTARNAAYQRLASQVEAGAGDFYNEFRGWFWGSTNWIGQLGSSAFSTAISGGSQMQITPTQMMEAAVGMGSANSVSAGDQQAIAKWLGSGHSVAEFSGFQGVYFGLLMSMMNRDVMYIKNVITMGIMIPLMSAGYAQVAYANYMVQAAGPFAAYAAIAAAGIRAAGMAQIAYGQTQIALSNAQYLMSNIMMFGMQVASVQSAGTGSTQAVLAKQREYEAAQAQLNYFTKVPDVQTMKQRLIQYGAQHGDSESANALYSLTDEDLKYLFDNSSGFKDSSGNAQTLSTQEEQDALEVTTAKDQATFVDSYGRRYDPTTLVYSPPGPLDGGVYKTGSGDYTRVQTATHNGSMVWGYAKIVGATNTYAVYNMGHILDMLVDHGQDLRDQARDAYIAEGNNVATQTDDMAFILAERDQTFDDLFNQAAGRVNGGREFSGYTMVYEEYGQNQRDIYAMELQQKAAIQQKEWDLREAQFLAKRDAWDKKMAVILDRGRKAWASSEDQFLQKWRDWEKQFDKDAAAGKAEWDKKIAQHFTDKKKWEADIRHNASVATIQNTLSKAIDDLNSQIRTARENIHANIPELNTTAMVQEAIADLKRKEPTLSEKFKEINANIDNFNTRLAISEITGSTTMVSSAITSAYKSQMETHEKGMKVLANVQIFEQYRRIVDEFKVGIENQNVAIENQTNAAALGQGFTKLGSTFIKKGAISSAWGAVNAYSWFDSDSAIQSGLQESGFTSLTGNALTNYLETKDQVEVDAFFYTQKLAVQTVFEKIMGKGTEAERKGSQDERVIGKFAKWAGKGPGSEEQSTIQGLNDAAKSHGVELKAQESQLLSAVGGFGELGEFGTRPGGAPMGFYLQMQLMGASVSQGDASKLAGMGGVDPLTTMINQYNPMAMMANSTLNVKIAAATLGKDEGYMWEAQAINLLKMPITMAGSAFMTAGVAAMVTGIGFVGGAIMAAGGMALSALGNSISVNPTTGERITKMTDQAAMNTGIATVTSFLGGAAQGFKALEGVAKTAEAAKGFAQSAQMAQSVAVAAGIVGTAATAGTRFDANGNRQGWSATSHNGDLHGEKLLLATGVSAATAAAGGAFAKDLSGTATNANLAMLEGFKQSLRSDFIGTAINVTAQYGAKQAWGAEHSSYDAMAHADLSRIGGLAMGAYLAGKDSQDRYQQTEYLKGVYADAVKQGNTAKAAEAYKALVAMGVLRSREEEQQEMMKKDLPVTGSDLAKLLRAAFNADGRLGNPNDPKSWEAGEKITTALTADVEALTAAKGGKLTIADAFAIADAHGIGPSILFTGANAAEAQRLFGQNWSGAYKELFGAQGYGLQQINNERTVGYTSMDPRTPDNGGVYNDPWGPGFNMSHASGANVFTDTNGKILDVSDPEALAQWEAQQQAMREFRDHVQAIRNQGMDVLAQGNSGAHWYMEAMGPGGANYGEYYELGFGVGKMGGIDWSARGLVGNYVKMSGLFSGIGPIADWLASTMDSLTGVRTAQEKQQANLQTLIDQAGGDPYKLAGLLSGFEAGDAGGQGAVMVADILGGLMAGGGFGLVRGIAAERAALRAISLERDVLMGSTPGKASWQGKVVIERMRSLGLIMEDPLKGTMFKDSKGVWRPLERGDMSHKVDAVKYWNEIGRKHGARSEEVRAFMKDPDNYHIDYRGINRGDGARIKNAGARYLPPLKLYVSPIK